MFEFHVEPSSTDSLPLISTRPFGGTVITTRERGGWTMLITFPGQIETVGSRRALISAAADRVQRRCSRIAFHTWRGCVLRQTEARLQPENTHTHTQKQWLLGEAEATQTDVVKLFICIADCSNSAHAHSPTRLNTWLNEYLTQCLWSWSIPSLQCENRRTISWNLPSLIWGLPIKTRTSVGGKIWYYVLTFAARTNILQWTKEEVQSLSAKLYLSWFLWSILQVLTNLTSSITDVSLS